MSLVPPVTGAEASLAAPSFSASIYTVYDGLTGNSAQVVMQTRDGYIWVGSDVGLARFDGVHFTTFQVADIPELRANSIRSLYQTKDDWLWIATQHGLCRYREGKFERVGLEETPITTIVSDDEERLWIATLDKGLWEYRNGQLLSHADDPGAPQDKRIAYLNRGAGGRLWVGELSGLFSYQGGTYHPFILDGGKLPSPTRMFETPGYTYVLSENSIVRMHGADMRSYGKEEGLSGSRISNIYLDRANRLWVVANNLYLLETPEADHFIKIPVLGVENCRSIMEDREGSYWIGTAGDGIVRLCSSGFRMLSSDDGMFGGNLRTVALDEKGTLWAGLASTGVARIEVDGKTSVVATALRDAGEVWSVCPASDGRLWLSIRGSLSARKDGRIEEFPQFVRVRALFEDHTGALWIGSESEGVTQYKDGKFTSLVDAIQAREPVEMRRVLPIAMAFAEGPEGTLYIGLRDPGGLAKIKDGVVAMYHPAEGFPTNDIRAIYPDREGNVWIGNRGRGLAVFSGGRWLNPEQLSKPFNYHISAIVEDEEGRIWLGTPKGIVWTMKAQLLAIARGENIPGTFRLASTADGVRPGVVGAGYFPNSVKTANGVIWFVTRRGLVSINPREVSLNHVIPPVQIERVVVDNHISYTGKEIKLPAGSRVLAIEYTALSFVRPDQVIFRYKLEGSDHDWVQAGPRRIAYYADLRPGTYHFRVLACNDDGVWNEAGASVAIVQMPFFYQTGWFYGIFALFLSGAGAGLYKWRTEALYRRNRQLEQRIADRTAELAKSYETIRASEYFYHSLVESLPQIIVRKDTQGRFTYANSAFAELIGRPLADIVGKGETDLYPTQEAAKSREDDLRVIDTRQTFEYESIVEKAGQSRRYFHMKKVPLYDLNGQPLGVQILSWDMTIFREIEEKLKQAQHELVETSRRAGIAEMATGILHNLGNALNSVNTTANLATCRIRQSKVSSLGKVVRLLAEQQGRLADFFTGDPRGKQLPTYLGELAGHLVRERDEIVGELEALQDSVNHIMELVASQQNYARVSGITEVVPPSELVEYALRVCENSLKRHDIAVAREFMPAPPAKVERQKALQILTNLVTNAKDSVSSTGRSDKRISLGVRASPEGRVQIYVTDNGVGILPENLTRIFAFGFTTKKNGHGFGLHSSALAAKELGGVLSVSSEGEGKGATFVLELPSAS